MPKTAQTTAQLYSFSHASKVMLKILQARLQQYVNHKLSEILVDFRKAEEPEIKLPTFAQSLKKQEHSYIYIYIYIYIYFCFIDCVKSFDCVDHNKLVKILQERGIPDHLTYPLRNLYAGQEATVRTGHGTTDWFQIGKGICQGCMLSPCLFNLHEEYIIRNVGLEGAQAGIKIAEININNLRYADYTTLMAESEEELTSLLLKVKEESGKAGLKLNI